MALLQGVIGLVMLLSVLGVILTSAPAKSKTDDTQNPSGRPPPTRIYLHPAKPSKRLSKPSKLPSLPSIPAPSFKGLKSPLKLPTVRIPQEK